MTRGDDDRTLRQALTVHIVTARLRTYVAARCCASACAHTTRLCCVLAFTAAAHSRRMGASRVASTGDYAHSQVSSAAGLGRRSAVICFCGEPAHRDGKRTGRRRARERAARHRAHRVAHGREAREHAGVTRERNNAIRQHDEAVAARGELARMIEALTSQLKAVQSEAAAHWDTVPRSRSSLTGRNQDGARCRAQDAPRRRP